MQITWSEYPTIDNGNSLVFNVTVDGRRVMVHITQEAEEDKGLPLCKAMAERRIYNAGTKGKLPERVCVTTKDFRIG